MSINGKHYALFGCGAFLLIFAIVAVIVIATFAGAYNTQKRLQVRYEAKVDANKTELSNLHTKLQEVADVSVFQMDSLRELFVANSEARTSEGQGQMMAWIKEAVPNVDQSSLEKVQVLIASTRDNWTRRQGELIDIAREYNTNLAVFPKNIILGLLGFEEIEADIITTKRADKAFETGNDEKLDLFKKGD